MEMEPGLRSQAVECRTVTLNTKVKVLVRPVYGWPAAESEEADRSCRSALSGRCDARKHPRREQEGVAQTF